MDNGLVFCVSTLYKVGKTIKRMRKRPRKTAKNKNHVDRVWGDQGKVQIYIPPLIDNYNYWMGGVDVSDQRIAYYQPNLRCRRNWIPMFIQILSLIRSNSYIVYKCGTKIKPMTHKKFTLEMIGKLMELAHKYMTIPYSRDTGNTPTRAATTGTAAASAKPSEPTPKR